MFISRTGLFDCFRQSFVWYNF